MQLNRETLKRDIDPQAFYRALGVFFVLLIALALSWGAARGSIVISPIRADAADYVGYAWNLKYKGVYSRDLISADSGGNPPLDAVRTPGYPLFLVPFVDRDRSSAFVARVQLVQSFIFALIVAASFLLLRQFMPYLPSLGAAGLTAISPHLVNSTIYILTETLFSFVLVVTLLLLAWLLRRPGILMALMAGLLMGYGALVRPSLQFFPIFVVPLVWLHLDSRLRGKVVGALAIGFLLVMTAWGIRNLDAIGEWSDSTLAINGLQHGTYPGMMYEGEEASRGIAYRYDPDIEESTESIGSVLLELRSDAAHEPAKYLYWYLIGKPLTFWQWNIIAGMGDIFVYSVVTSPYANLIPFTVTRTVMHNAHWPLVVLGAIGTILVFVTPLGRWIGTDRAGSVRLVAITLVYFTALHMVVAPYPRYSIPLRPELYGMAVFVMYFLYARFFSGIWPNRESDRKNSPPPDA